jgi:hypothetical protein
MNRSASTPSSRWIPQLCATVLTLVLAGSAVAAELAWPPPEPVQKRLAETLGLIDDLEALLPDDAEDLNDLAFAIDFEYDRALTLVRDRVRFEPYVGVLRGVEGTLATGRGNAWDQALLLASLLKTLGAEAQVVSAPLDPIAAEQLLARTLSAPPPTDAPFELEALIERTAAYDVALAEALRAAPDADGDLDTLERSTSRIQQQLLALLEGAGVDLPDLGDLAARVNAIAGDYAWVRWRIGPGDEWLDAHPAFPAGQAPKLEPQRFHAEEVPHAQLHRVAVQLFIERGPDDGRGEPERVPVMQRYERPVANLYTHQLELGMAPRPSGETDSGSILVPMMNGQLAPGGQAVTELGLTADASMASSGAGELFATVSTGLGNAAGALGGLQDGESRISRLLGIVLVVEVLRPGAEPIIAERRVADLRPAGRRFPRDAAFGMVLDVGIGDEGGARLTRRMLSQQKSLLEATPALMASARGALERADALRQPGVRRLEPAGWLDIDLLGPAFHPAPDGRRALFRDGPLLAARRTFTAPDADSDSGLVTVTDILFNRATVLERDENGDLQISPSAAMAHGVRETLLESRLAGRDGGWAERTPKRLLLDRSALSSFAQDWPPGSREQAERDLQAGYLLALTDGEEPHWWRIHPESGNTLGMSRHGGSEFTEYLILIGGAALSTYFFYISVENCDATYPDNREMADCCIVGNLAVTYGTSVAGAARSAWLAKPWEAASGKLIAELGKETATNFIVGEVTSPLIEGSCSWYLSRQ